MKFLIFTLKWLKTFKNMIKVYEVSRKYIMPFMHNNRYLTFNWFTYLLCIARKKTSWNFWNISEIFHAKEFREILHHYLCITDVIIFPKPCLGDTLRYLLNASRPKSACAAADPTTLLSSSPTIVCSAVIDQLMTTHQSPPLFETQCDSQSVSPVSMLSVKSQATRSSLLCLWVTLYSIITDDWYVYC